MIVAHRGASHDAPENTLAAFELAWQKESDGIEGDFYLTADNQIVCIHDRDTERTTGKKMTVESSSLDELRKLEYGTWKDSKFAGEPIPTFADVFRSVPLGKTFVIELKSKAKIVPHLAKQLRRLDQRKIKILIISFDVETCRQCKELMPQYRVHWLTGFKKSDDGLHPTADEIVQTVAKCRADGVGMQGNTGLITEEFVDTLHQGECGEFHVWTIDRIEDAAHFQKLGAFGITTNRPAFIRSGIVK